MGVAADILAAIAALDSSDPDYQLDAIQVLVDKLGGGPRTAEIAIDFTQTGPSGGNHVEFNQIGGSLADAGLVSLSTGAGQQRGIITLQAGTAYRLIANAACTTGGTRTLRYRIHSPDSGVEGIAASGVNVDSMIYVSGGGDISNPVSLLDTVELSSDTNLVLRASSALSSVRAGSRILISEIAG